MQIRPHVEEGSPPIHYVEAGSGPTILFLHGFNGGARLWSPNIADIAPAGFRCLAPDLPGWGDTPPPDNFSYRMEELVPWLVAFLDRHAREPVTVVGHSFGGAVALHLALAHPERVNGLVLVNSAGLSPKSKIHYRLLCIPALGELMLRPNPDKIRRGLVSFAVDRLEKIPEDLLADIDRMVQHPWFVQTSLNWVRRNGVWWRGGRRISVRDRLAAVHQPTLLLAGDGDRVVDPEDSIQAAALMPRAQLEVFPGALHLLPLDRRPEFGRHVVEFASSVQSFAPR